MGSRGQNFGEFPCALKHYFELGELFFANLSAERSAWWTFWISRLMYFPPKMPERCVILVAILYMFGQAMNSCTPPFLGLL